MFRIAELREKMGISMRKVAIELGIPYTTYISYEKETREPNSETLIKLADYFNCSIDYLVGRNDKKTDIQVEFHITDHEREVVIAYRKQPSMQLGVDRMLGVAPHEDEKEKRA